jgi:hypothetical protein
MIMSSVKGTFENGVARPLEPVGKEREGQEVVITFVDEAPTGDTTAFGAGWETLAALLDDCAVEVDATDLAHEHDHYLYGKPKQN